MIDTDLNAVICNANRPFLNWLSFSDKLFQTIIFMIKTN